MPEAHSYWSASKFALDLACPGSKVLGADVVDTSSESAAWGTVAHDIADWCHRKQARADDHPSVGSTVEQDGFEILVSGDMIACVNDYLDQCDELSTGADRRWSEQQVNYSQWLNTGRGMAWGTLDFSALWIEQRKLLIADLKTGKGVTVSPVENEQLMLYAGGKLAELEPLGVDVDTITLAIIQNRVGDGRAKTWDISVADLKAWLLGRARSGVVTVENAKRLISVIPDPEWQATFLHTGEHCREKFCPVRAACPALRGAVTSAVFDAVPASPDEFQDLSVPSAGGATDTNDWLAAALSKVDMIEDWCKQVREQANARAIDLGQEIPGFKVVAGRKGARAWSNAAEAEQMLKTFRLKQEEMYEFKLISPAAAEKLAKAETIGKRQWLKLQALISQSDGKPTLVPVSDPREAITVRPVADEFEPVAPSAGVVDIDAIC